MAIGPRVAELLEELHDSGRTPEEVCAESPELLPEVRERWRRVRLLEAELDAAFPAEGRELDPGPAAPGAAPLPRIPGYEVERQVGRGGMGVVFRARHLRLNRVVALKLAIAGAYASPRERERFRREAEAVAALRDPHVVRIYDVGDSEGRPFYTMELVEGGNLAERAKPLLPREAAALVRSLAGGVEAAHAAGIVHRDLKPANVLLEADGTPKIADFGLSRRLDDATGLTLHGAVLGTPSYMAPEQAGGATAGPGTAVDVYALGAILYELLAGRPPHRAATPAETIRDVLHADPIPPSRLNPRVPRDLEIVCRRCLAKDPARRYPSAAALGADLGRFLDGEAIEAKPEGRAGRAWRRVARHPRLAATLAGATLLTAALAGVSLRLAAEQAEAHRRATAERAALEGAAAADLRDLTRLMGARAWAGAGAAAERLAGRLGEHGSPALLTALDRARRDLALVARLEAIRLDRAGTTGGRFDHEQTGRSYAGALREFGLGGADEAPEVVAARIRASGARLALVDALDDWSVATPPGDRKDWLLRTAGLSEGGRGGDWAAAARDPASRRTRGALERLVEQAPVADRPVTLLLAVAEDLSRAGGDPLPTLARIQAARPGDFWANVSLGSVLAESGRYVEGLRFLQAALAIRPDAAIVANNLGRCLTDAGRPAEAIEYFRLGVRLDPSASSFRYNLGLALRTTREVDAAIEQIRAGLRSAPDDALLRAGLGDCLASQARLDEALAAYSVAIARDPRLATARMGMVATLIRLGRPDDALQGWRAAIDAAGGDLDVGDGYAELCLFLDKPDAYRAARRDLLGRAAGLAAPRAAERVGRACLLLPGTAEEMAAAAGLIDRALAAPAASVPPWARPYFLLARALADYRLDRWDEAIAILQGEAASVLGPCPLLITAMAQHRLGRDAEARGSYDRAVGSFDFGRPHPDTREQWIYHALQREAAALLGDPGPGR